TALHHADTSLAVRSQPEAIAANVARCRKLAAYLRYRVPNTNLYSFMTQISSTNFIDRAKRFLTMSGNIYLALV
ncbi:MAG: hypothetical protein ABJQ38_04705, partial [Flavobacteriaceae bacterium]